jgi:hypothetical protein
VQTQRLKLNNNYNHNNNMSNNNMNNNKNNTNYSNNNVCNNYDNSELVKLLYIQATTIEHLI